MRERIGSDAKMANELRRLRMPTVERLLARILKPDFVLDRDYANLPVISDLRNDLAFQVAAPLSLTRLDYNPYDTLRWFETGRTGSAAALAPSASHLGRLLYRLPDFPLNWMDVASAPGDPPVALADANWPDIVRLFDEYRLAVRSEDLPAAEALLQTCLSLAPEQPLVLLELAKTQLALGGHSTAAHTLERFLAIEPDEAIGHYNLGLALLGAGEVAGALVAAERTVALAAESPWSYRLRGQARRDAGKLVSALQDYERARELAPDDISLLQEQAALLETLRGSGDD